MKQSRLSIRYAKSLLQLAVEEKVLEEVYNDMSLIKSICLENKDFTLLLKSPIIKTDQKQKILYQMFNSRLSRFSMLFINIITSKKREAYIQSIINSFIDLYKLHNKIESASITTAVPLSEELKQEIIRLVKNKSGINVELKEVVDREIIGGSIIKIGDKQIDSSVSKSILELKQKFNKNLYIQDY
tara:strand:- start:232 stop:789 length:558 start_codon:yes stop_codon:yes gene_type:complete